MSEGEELTTGWEADVPVGDSVLRRFLYAEVTRARLVAESSGGTVEQTDEFLVAAPVDGYLFDTGVFLLKPPTAVDPAKAVEAATRLIPAERPWVLYSMWPTPDLRPLGLDLMGHPPIMMRPPGGDGPPADGRLRIVEGTSAADLAEYSKVLRESFPMTEGGGLLVAPEGLGGNYRCWLGYEGDRAVTVAAAHVSHGVVDVTYVATVPDCRGRGYGRAITWQALSAAPDLPAVLIASDDGRPVYERLGFYSLLRITLWWRPVDQGASE